MAEAEQATAPKYRRVVLKISGEGFVHPGERGIAMDAVLHIARQTYRAAQHGVQIAVVIGGGNILAGPSSLPATRAFTRPRRITWACWPR